MPSPLTRLDLVPFPARAAGDIIRAYQPAEAALITLSSGRLHRIDVVQVFADGAMVVETVRQRLNGGGDYLRGGHPRWALRTLERLMTARDAQLLRDAITAAELDRTMREQMATDPEVGGPRDPELPPVQRQPDHLGNHLAREGVDRCVCGCKYWEGDRCVDCGAAFPGAPVTTDPGATVAEVGGRMVFRLTQHGIRQLAEGLGTTAEHFAEVARRNGWQVEDA